jgi:hypothetical protein
MTISTTAQSSPRGLAIRLAVYFFALFGSVIAVINYWPDAMQYLPFGGRDALEGTRVQSAADFLKTVSSQPSQAVVDMGNSRPVQTVILFVVGHLSGTILLMLPITWTYTAINFETGFRRSFARALIVLPICATTVVLLIQDSLALAFGLAALVAAVRFRVALDEAMDGIYIFAAICVGLAAGVGYLGVAMMMSLFFCFATTIMWAANYGSNPVDEARITRKRSKLEG